MFVDNDLIDHLEQNNSIKVNSLIIAEWNQNSYENIANYGNYSDQYSTYDQNDTLNKYTDGLESTTISKYRTDNENEPLVFIDEDSQRKLHYPLLDCFNSFRPRSGINKMLYVEGNYIDSIRSSGRPRYYFSSRKDNFKYWNSYRTIEGVVTGMSGKTPVSSASSGYTIGNTNPFVVYKSAVATNKIVVKMQTHLANPNVVSIDGTSIVRSQIRVNGNSKITDPFLNRTKSTVPLRWKVQYLNSSNEWIDAISFDENSQRNDSTPIVPWDGTVEIAYGLLIPEDFRSNFNLVRSIDSTSNLPDTAFHGEAYLVGANILNAGDLYIWDSVANDWNVSAATYQFSLMEDTDIKRIWCVTKLADPDYYYDETTKVYREFLFIHGLRVCVERMQGPDKPFELIEMSPRLKADLSNYATSFDLVKDIAATDFALPVGGLAATTGRISLSNHDGSFTESNTFNTTTSQGSIIYNNLKPQIKFDFYEGVINVNGYDKYIPLKSLYSENSANVSDGMKDVSLSLRDLFFRIENSLAPSTLIQNCTLTKAVSIVLDNIGFSNYVFKSISTANDPLIPFFFIEPDVSAAEVLQRLAQATQCAMFFDEYNNFVVMPKEYLMPDVEISDNDSSISNRLITLYGQKTGNIVPNIESISNVDSVIVNDGEINYSIRHIQRQASSLKQATELDIDRTYSYRPSLLWQLGSDKSYRDVNDYSASGDGYALTAVPLNLSLTDVVPYVENRQIKNNIIDVGENAQFVTKFQGYFYANGEVIRYDAQEFSISGTGNVWITDSLEYQKYASKLPFNGKIYPTGLLRIFVEPFYEEVSGETVYVNGQVREHGRGQFGTKVTSHSAGLDSHWTNINNRRCFRMDSNYLFSTVSVESINYPQLSASVSTTGIGQDSQTLRYSEILGKIANFNRKSIRSENNYTISSSGATVQTSSLLFSGPKVLNNAPSTVSNTVDRDVVTYVYKELDSNYKHIGTRMRIIGKQTGKTQQSTGQSLYITSADSDLITDISASSGGIGIMVNPENNSGYYLEICAFDEDSVKSLGNSGSALANDIIFYKVSDKSKNSPETGKNTAVPIKLWGANAQVLADSNVFAGLERFTTQFKQSVYDLGIEWEIIEKGNNNIAPKMKFYIYVNNVLVATVIDNSALENTLFNACLFVRSSSNCMFDNIYALKNSISQRDTVTAISSSGINKDIISTMFNSNENGISVAESLRKYALSGIIQATHLSSIGSEKPSQYSIYMDEFGTVLRECVYFNIKYDQSYPAFTSRINPPMSAEKSYVVGGFVPNSYGAEFLVFNATDGVLDLSDSTSNNIMISGITFTQNVSNTITVDDYFKELSNFSDPVILNSSIVSPQKSQKVYDDIRSSRSLYGKKGFALDSIYIQDTDSAKSLMRWLINKTLRPRKVLEIDAFGVPHLQLGDIVKIDYDLPEGVKFVDIDKRFVIVSINYERSKDNVISQLRLLEV